MVTEIHVVHKEDITRHATVEVSPKAAPLPDGSVRVRPKILSITMTNKTYAELGSIFDWWNAWPLPPSVTAPFNNGEQWGIVPSWGYGEIVESKNPGLTVGTLLFGQWPTSSLSVEMKFMPTGKPGHFTEVSEHRQALMTLYNQFQVARRSESEHDMAWNSAAMVVWSAGWLLTKFCFPMGNTKPINPMGNGEWSKSDADLRCTVVVSLAASSKTARGFSWGLSDRTPGNSPLAMLEVTSSPKSLKPMKSSECEAKVISYDELCNDDIITSITNLKPTRVLVTDFGSPLGIAQRFHDTIMSSNAAPSAFDYLMVGVKLEWLQSSDSRTRKYFLNTSPLMDTVIVSEGIDSIYNGRKDAFDLWLQAKGPGNMSLQWGSGINGVNGIEGAWEALVNNKLPRDKALVFSI